jgi:hypothetical protein
MDKTRAWILVLGVLTIFALFAVGLVWAVSSVLKSALTPVEQMTGLVGAQVADVLKPTPTILPNPVTIVRSVRSLARLETIEYAIEKVITAETGQGALASLFGDRLILVAHGEVLAGVDLNKLGPKDMWLEGEVLYVDLPEAEIFEASLDNEKTYVYSRERGLLTRGGLSLEGNARSAAEDEIEKAAMENGILDQARRNAEAYLYGFLVQLGYPEVIFVQPAAIPTPTSTPTPTRVATPATP